MRAPHGPLHRCGPCRLSASSKGSGDIQARPIVDAYARRLQIQEKLTSRIATAMNDVLEPKGVGVVIEASHQCMTTRGIHKPGVSMVTSHMLGRFRSDPSTRREFLALIAPPPPSAPSLPSSPPPHHPPHAGAGPAFGARAGEPHPPPTRANLRISGGSTALQPIVDMFNTTTPGGAHRCSHRRSSIRRPRASTRR